MGGAKIFHSILWYKTGSAAEKFRNREKVPLICRCAVGTHLTGSGAMCIIGLERIKEGWIITMPDQENEKSEKRSSASRKPIPVKIQFPFAGAVKLLVLGVILYVFLSHLGAVGTFFVFLYHLLQPFIIGGLIALVLNTPMNALERLFTWLEGKWHVREHKRAKSVLALLLTIVLALLLLTFIANSIIPQVFESLKSLVTAVPTTILPKLIDWLKKIDTFGIDTDQLVSWLSDIKLQEVLAGFGNDLVSALASGATTIGGVVGNLISGTFTGILSIIFAIYVLATKKTLGCQIKRLSYAYLKKSFVDRALGLCSLTADTFSHFISGQCLDAVLLGVLLFLSMTIFRFPYALPVSTLVAVTAVIPYVGAFLGGAFGALLMIANNPLQALLFIVLFVVVQQIDNNFFYPRVVGNSVGLPAIWTFAAVIIGESLLGVVGMLLFIPIFSVLYTLLRNNVRSRLAARGIVVEGDEPTEEWGGRKPFVKPETAEKIRAFFAGLWQKIRAFFADIWQAVRVTFRQKPKKKK